MKYLAYAIILGFLTQAVKARADSGFLHPELLLERCNTKTVDPELIPHLQVMEIEAVTTLAEEVRERRTGIGYDPTSDRQHAHRALSTSIVYAQRNYLAKLARCMVQMLKTSSSFADYEVSKNWDYAEAIVNLRTRLYDEHINAIEAAIRSSVKMGNAPDSELKVKIEQVSWMQMESDALELLLALFTDSYSALPKSREELIDRLLEASEAPARRAADRLQEAGGFWYGTLRFDKRDLLTTIQE